jgi:hypothetical protein
MVSGKDVSVLLLFAVVLVGTFLGWATTSAVFGN